MAGDNSTRSRRPRRLRTLPRPSLTAAQILGWADEFYKCKGRWPGLSDGRIRETWNDTWLSVDEALRRGCRGLKPGSSLARLLNEHRGVRNRKALPPYTIDGILAWADRHRLHTGRWPGEDSGPVAEAPGETWRAVESALRTGIRGLPGGSSLAKLLAEYRGARNPANLPRLTISGILAWADAHQQRTGRWPMTNDGPIPESSGDSWQSVGLCLIRGRRGLPGGQSLAQLLSARRGVRNRKALPHYTERMILSWADSYHKRTRAWPTLHSGAILEAPGETWCAVDAALAQGTRGLRGGSTLARLLHRRRGVRHKGLLPRLSLKRILAWARAHRRLTGELPKKSSGPILDSPDDTWMAVDMALTKGHRGLPGGSSLAKLLKQGINVAAARKGAPRNRRALN